MKIIRNTIPIADLNQYYKDGDLVINKDYQRVKGLWPSNARSYFIDTILNGFPFPKITLKQSIDLKTKKSIREIIDGQQRFTTIVEFLNDKMKLTSVSKEYSGSFFSDLIEEVQSEFLSYEVSVDTAIGATNEEVIDIFRRINSYSLPLNRQEQRHASYQGDFKWFIKELIDLYSPMLEKYKILSNREIARMVDADLFTELCQVCLMDGIVTRSPKKLDNIYKNNDDVFLQKSLVEERLFSTLDFIKTELTPILSTEILSSFTFYSLFSALIYNRWGIEKITSENLDQKPTIGTYYCNLEISIEKIMNLLNDLDQKIDDGPNAEFVKACLITTHSISNRMVRLKYFVKALQD